MPFDPSFKKEPAKEIFSDRETAKNLTITPPESEESGDDESIVDHPLVKKRKLMSTDDGTLMKAEDQMILQMTMLIKKMKT